MKFFKIFMFLAAASVLGSCSSDEIELNKNEATVAMQNGTMTISEAKGLFNVPVSVSGDRNGMVRVTVEVAEVGSNPAKEDTHYLVTTKTINISSDQTTGNVEIMAVDDEDINENRQFTVKIVKVQGGTLVDGSSSTVVTLKDNDAAFYEKFAGKWTMVFQSAYEEEPDTWDLQIITAEENDPDYDHYMYVKGMMGQSWTVGVLEYNYDKETKKGTLSFVPSLFAQGVNFGSIGVQDVYLYGMNSEGRPVETPLVGTWSDDFKSITFDPSVGAQGLYFYIEAGYTWDKGTVVSMTKK